LEEARATKLRLGWKVRVSKDVRKKKRNCARARREETDEEAGGGSMGGGSSYDGKAGF